MGVRRWFFPLIGIAQIERWIFRICIFCSMFDSYRYDCMFNELDNQDNDDGKLFEWIFFLLCQLQDNHKMRQA